MKESDKVLVVGDYRKDCVGIVTCVITKFNYEEKDFGIEFIGQVEVLFPSGLRSTFMPGELEVIEDMRFVRKSSLSQMLADAEPQEEMDWGPDVGGEILPPYEEDQGNHNPTTNRMQEQTMLHPFDTDAIKAELKQRLEAPEGLLDIADVTVDDDGTLSVNYGFRMRSDFVFDGNVDKVHPGLIASVIAERIQLDVEEVAGFLKP